MSRPPWPSSNAPPRQPSFQISSRRLGLYVLFGSLGVLFVASLVGYLVTRNDSARWVTPGTPPPPAGLWLSTGLVLSISAALEGARRAARKNQLAVLPRRLMLGLALAVAFLCAQAFNWYTLSKVALAQEEPALIVFGFYLLTGLHAAHVIGGLIPLSLVLSHALDREYSSSRYEGLGLCTDYWHFLTIVWMVLFFVLENFR
jgi:cytochrome c oxidase subunit III